MSKLVFWSPLHGQGQTSNLHIIGLIMSLLHNKRVLLTQTHLSMNNLEGPLVGKNVDINEIDDSKIFQDIGLDAAVMFSKMNLLMEKVLESCCITFPNSSLLLMPGTKTRSLETFDRDIGNAICPMIQKAENYVDIVMIDANSGKNDLSFKLMSMADLVVINLSQRRYVLNKFFDEYGEDLKEYKKVFYILGNYDKNSGYNIFNCRRKHGRYINKFNSGVIPYSSKYMDAQNESNIMGMVKEWFRINKYGEGNKISNLVKKKLKWSRYLPEENDYFFNQACSCVSNIMDMLNTNKDNSLVKRSGA
ncbi:MAG: hypothetical protein QM217_09030 [Bacillota bacterium]|nr:hypothetical protein [Bacillota bacterium]